MTQRLNPGSDLEAWVFERVEVLLRDQPENPVLEQRLACGLVQARAFECRKIAGQFGILSNEFASRVSMRCMDRSHTLETLALEYAAEWPPERVKPKLFVVG